MKLGQPKIGQHVYAKITRVDFNFAKAEILAIVDQADHNEYILLKTTFQGIIFKENVRSFDLEGVQLQKCFRPNDIIKAKVLTEQLGGKESSTALSTVDDELGVVFARSEESGVLMIPRSWNQSQCPITGRREKRKNAPPPKEVTPDDSK